MTILHIDSDNIKELNKFINSGNNVFLLIYMEDCKPCNDTKPEWKKLENLYKNKKNIVVADIERTDVPLVTKLNFTPKSFPTILFITNKGTHIETIEQSDFHERNIDTFVKWINTKNKEYNNQKGGTKKRKSKYKKTKKRKWSQKYKRSINCKRPKGFSQKQFCKSKN